MSRCWFKEGREKRIFQGHTLSFPNIPLHTHKRRQQKTLFLSTPRIREFIAWKRESKNLSLSCFVVLRHNKSDDVISISFSFENSFLGAVESRSNADKNGCGFYLMTHICSCFIEPHLWRRNCKQSDNTFSVAGHKSYREFSTFLKCD
jgi:hypothetical protein